MQEFVRTSSRPDETTETSALVNSTSTVLSDEMDNVDGTNKRQATRVFKKSSLNGKITVYLGKRDFVDHITNVDPIGKYSRLSIQMTVLLLAQPVTFDSFLVRNARSH